MSKLSIESVVSCRKGEGIVAKGRIPEGSEFFQDHFPGFPVLPGVLALEMLKQTAESYLQAEGSSHSEKFFLKHIRATKFHTYLKPGDEWESRLELMSTQADETHWNARLFHQGKVAVSAHLVLAPSHANQNQVVSQGG